MKKIIYIITSVSIGGAYQSEATGTEFINTNYAQTGFTGLLRTPNANTLNYGELLFALNVEDNIDYATPYYSGAHNTILLGTAIFPGLEFTAQDTYKRFQGDSGYGDAGSDLSFSFKASSQALFPDSPFSLALGIQDLGGLANHHDNQYLVSSYQWESLRLSLGYGQGNANNQMGEDYLNDLFGGLEWQAFDWLQLVADYDGTGFNQGVKFTTVNDWLPWGAKASLNLLVESDSSTLNRDNQYAGIQLSLPMTLPPMQSSKNTTSLVYLPETRLPINEATPGTGTETETVPSEYSVAEFTHSPLTLANDSQAIIRVMDELSKQGFQNLKYNLQADVTNIAYENNVFNRNEVDGLGVTLGIISKHISGKFNLFLLNNKIPVLNIQGSGNSIAHLFHSEDISPTNIYFSNSNARHYYDINWFEPVNTNSAWLPRINLSPNLRSTLGTEFGVFDYSAALATNLVWNLWSGASLDVRHLLPITASSDVKNYSWHPVTEHQNEIDRILVHQAFNLPFNTFTQFSVGQVFGDYEGWLNESRWQSTSGVHKISAKFGQFNHKHTDAAANPKFISYRYYIPTWDWALEVQNGEYWAGDSGYAFKSHHWFGDVQMSFEVHTTDQSYAGLYFSLPLTFRKDMNPRYGQITGIDQWRWGYYTKITGELNDIVASAIWEPSLQHDVERRYFNRDRLNPTYLQTQLLRMKDAYQEYSQD